MFGFRKKKEQPKQAERVIRNDIDFNDVVKSVTEDYARNRPETDDIQSLLKILGSDLEVKNRQFDGDGLSGGSNLFTVMLVMICQLHSRVEELENAVMNRGNRNATNQTTVPTC